MPTTYACIGNESIPSVNRTVMLPQRIYINEQNRLYNSVCNCICDDSSKIKKLLFSQKMLLIMIIFTIGKFFVKIVVSFEVNVYLYVFLASLQQIVTMTMLLCINIEIFKFISNTFTFWWKLIDSCVWMLCAETIDYTHKLLYWGFNNSKYDSTLKYFIAIIESMQLIEYTFLISSIQSFVIQSIKYETLVSNLIIMVGVVAALFSAILHFTTPNDDYIIHIQTSNDNNLYLSCRTILIEKTIDLSIFYLSQIYGNIAFGTRSFPLVGHITKKWIKLKRYDVLNHKDASIQLLHVDVSMSN